MAKKLYTIAEMRAVLLKAVTCLRALQIHVGTVGRVASRLSDLSQDEVKAHVDPIYELVRAGVTLDNLELDELHGLEANGALFRPVVQEGSPAEVASFTIDYWMGATNVGRIKAMDADGEEITSGCKAFSCFSAGDIITIADSRDFEEEEDEDGNAITTNADGDYTVSDIDDGGDWIETEEEIGPRDVKEDAEMTITLKTLA